MRNLIFGFVVILLCSCSRVLYDISYKGETNYKEFYIVDTILIESPVRVFSEKYGGMFVLSNEKLKSYDGKIDFFTIIRFKPTILNNTNESDVKATIINPVKGNVNYVSNTDGAGGYGER